MVGAILYDLFVLCASFSAVVEVISISASPARFEVLVGRAVVDGSRNCFACDFVAVFVSYQSKTVVAFQTSVVHVDSAVFKGMVNAGSRLTVVVVMPCRVTYKAVVLFASQTTRSAVGKNS